MTEDQLKAIEERSNGKIWGYEQMKLDVLSLVSFARSIRSELRDIESLHKLAVKERNAAWKKVETLEKEIDKLLGG